MVLLRLLAIIFLVYLGYRYLTKIKQGKKREEPVIDNATQDILEEDPVCKKLVPQRQAVVYQENGKRVYFCSKECCQTYRKNRGES